MSDKVHFEVCDRRNFLYEGSPDIPADLTIREYRKLHPADKARRLAPVIAAVKRHLHA